MTLVDILFFSLILLLIMAFFGAIWMIGGYILAWDIDRRYRACPNCKRKAAGTIIDTEVEHLNSHIDHQKLTRFRVKREKVTDHYQCDSCQHTWVKSFERETKTPIGG